MISINLAVNTSSQSNPQRTVNPKKVKPKKKKWNKKYIISEEKATKNIEKYDGHEAEIRNSISKKDHRYSTAMTENLRAICPNGLHIIFLPKTIREKNLQKIEKKLYIIDIFVLIISLIGLVIFVWEVRKKIIKILYEIFFSINITFARMKYTTMS